MSSRLFDQAADRGRVARYLLVGIISYGFDAAILMVCFHVLHLPLWLATSLGFWGSFAVNFVLSRNWTFSASHLAPGGQLARFSVIVGINYVVTIAAVTTLHQAGLGVLAARTLTLGVLTTSTFLIHRWWVFAHKETLDD